MLRDASRLRAGLTVVLVVAALACLLVSVLALWTQAVIFDTDAYVGVVGPVAEDPAVRASIADYVALKAVQAADLDDRLEEALPPGARLAGPALTQAVRQLLVGETERFLATAEARRVWVDVNRAAHQRFVSALRDDDRSVTVGPQDVRLDLFPLVAVALQKLERKMPGLLGRDVALPPIAPATAPSDIRTLVQDALGRQLPADFATVTLLQGDGGYRAKQTLRLFEGLVVLVVVLTAVLAAAALLLSQRRRRTALWLGLGALLAFAVARVVEARLERLAADAVEAQGGAAVARSVLTSAIASLNGFLVWIAVAGVVVAAAAFLAARPGWMDAIGRGAATLFGMASDLPTPDTRSGRWIAQHLDLLRVAGVAVAVVVLLPVSGSPAAVLCLLLALAVYELALTAYGAGVPKEPRVRGDGVPQQGPGEGDPASGDAEEPA